jgi:trehalose 6-phosphate phosphatase
MPLHLFDPLDDLATRIRAGRRVLLFTDFDGTLVPIKDNPMACSLSSDDRALLARIAARPNALVAVVSGRDLADLMPRVGVEGIVYAGNHGLEIRGPGFDFREPGAVALAPKLAKIVAELTAALADVPGTWVQNKELSASVHFRQTPPDWHGWVRETVERVLNPHLDEFVSRGGKMVLEVRPRVDWHKGRAVHWLWQRLAGNDPNPVAIYLGDDATDEDAFQAIPDGVTIMVGPSRRTAARHRLNDSADVSKFLAWLAEGTPSRV